MKQQGIGIFYYCNRINPHHLLHSSKNICLKSFYFIVKYFGLHSEFHSFCAISLINHSKIICQMRLLFSVLILEALVRCTHSVFKWVFDSISLWRLRLGPWAVDFWTESSIQSESWLLILHFQWFVRTQLWWWFQNFYQCYLLWSWIFIIAQYIFNKFFRNWRWHKGYACWYYWHQMFRSKFSIVHFK